MTTERRHYVVVVAEDDPVINRLLAELLTEEGYSVVSCVSGAAAYQLATRLLPDAVVTDLNMEEPAAGLRLLEQLRADPATAKVGVLACSADDEALRRNAALAAELGATVVRKPFELEAFLQALRRTLERV